MEAKCKHGFKFNECASCRRLIEFNLEHPFVPTSVKKTLRRIFNGEMEEDPEVILTVKALGGEIK